MAADDSSPPPYRRPAATATPPSWFPVDCVYDPHLEQQAYACNDDTPRTGVSYAQVPGSPLSAAFLPKHVDGSKTFFYSITVGQRVGIVTDAYVYPFSFLN